MKNMNKTRFAAAFTAVVLSLGVLSGCQGGEGAKTSSTADTASSSTESTANTESTASTETDSDKVYNIGICQLVQHEALDAATKGFTDKLTELLGKDKVKIDLQNAQGDSPTCATICNQFVANKSDLILANATPALQAAVAATGDIPILGTSVTDYATALEIKDFSGTTGRNISGTSDLAPLDKQAEMLTELFPEAKTVGILYCSAEANSKYQYDTIAPMFTESGLTVKEYTFSDSNDISQVTTTACSECDVLYIPTDNQAASNVELINNIALPAKTPIVAGEENICKGCGVATLSISYYDLGVKTGEMAYDILKNGKDVKSMEIAYAPATTKKYMKDRAQQLGVTIPDGYEEIVAE